MSELSKLKLVKTGKNEKDIVLFLDNQKIKGVISFELKMDINKVSRLVLEIALKDVIFGGTSKNDIYNNRFEIVDI
jgi:hypothetical protein